MTFKYFMYIGISPLGHLHSGIQNLVPRKISTYIPLLEGHLLFTNSVEGEMFSESQLGLTSIQGTRPFYSTQNVTDHI